MPKKIYVSHTLKDTNYIKEVKPLLRKHNIITNDSYTVIDSYGESTRVGENIRETIKKHIKSANMFVLVINDKSVTSQRVNYEAGMADALGKPIIVLSSEKSDDNNLLANISKYKYIEIKDIPKINALDSPRKYRGTVKSFDHAKGHGYIKMDDGPDIYFERSDIVNKYTKLAKGDIVNLRHKKGKKGGSGLETKRVLKTQ